MFFKNVQKVNTKSADIACWVTFIVWGAILFINSIFELFMDRTLISSSMVILIIGLIIFFTLEFILRFSKNK